LVAERSALAAATRTKFDEIDELRRLLATRASVSPKDGQLEAVVQRALLWKTNLVTVCFFDGDQRIRDNVAEVASQWTIHTGLKFDFGSSGNRRTCDPAKPSDIRISFLGVGYWSYVGIQALEIPPDRQTLNLDSFDRRESLADDDKGIILHEFGHAIGFEHEHQSPVSGCEEEFDWARLPRLLNWSDEEIKRNMRRLDTSSSKSGLLTTAFDPQSVMLYSLDERAFKAPATARCYIRQPNTVLSNVDVKAASEVYPMGAQSLVAQPPATPSRAPLADNSNISSATQQINRLRLLTDAIGSKRQ
jgi:hypothetical protein